MPVKAKDTITRTRTVSCQGSEQDTGYLLVADLLDFAERLVEAGVPKDTRVKMSCTYSGFTTAISVRSTVTSNTPKPSDLAATLAVLGI